jgi:hypothetical protein
VAPLLLVGTSRAACYVGPVCDDVIHRWWYHHGSAAGWPPCDTLVGRPDCNQEVALAVVRLLFRAELRQRWRSWLLLALLVALMGGLVLAGVAAGRRTDAAFPAYLRVHGFDAIVYSAKPQPTLAGLPDVASVTTVVSPAASAPTCSCTHNIGESGFNLYDMSSDELPRLAKLVAGRMPDPSAPEQVLASFTMEQDGVRIGTVMKVPMYSPAQEGVLVGGGNPAPSGPTLTLHLVGFEAAEAEFPGGAIVTNDLYGTPALAQSISGRTAQNPIYFVRLKDGAAGLPRFEANEQALGPAGGSDEDTAAATITSSIHPQAVGWWILAGLTALVGMIVIAQALVRQSAIEETDRRTLRSLGVGSDRLFLVGMARTFFIAVVGAGGAIAFAFLLSPLTPVGEARLAEVTRTGSPSMGGCSAWAPRQSLWQCWPSECVPPSSAPGPGNVVRPSVRLSPPAQPSS